MRKAIWLLAVACLATAPAGCGGGFDEGDGADGAGGTAKQSVTVGSANFPENALLAEVYAGALRAKGIDVSMRLNIGSREALLPALEKGDITVLPEYTGALLSYVTKGKGTAKKTADQVVELTASLPPGLTLLEPSQAQDQGTVTCTRAIADRYSLTSLEDLARVSRQITMGGPPEFAKREGRGLKGLKAVYGIEFKRFRPLDIAGPLTVSALKEGKVDCADLFSTQSAIEVNGFVPLTDPRGLIESEAVVPLIAKSAATPEVTGALNGVSAKLTTDNLKRMVKRVEVDKEDPATVAGDFLSEHGLK
jgi:osmoprotectant transport system substrate-binding protein